MTVDDDLISPRGSACLVCRALNDPNVADKLQVALAMPRNPNGRGAVSNASISKWLTKNGHPAGVSSVSRHRTEHM